VSRFVLNKIYFPDQQMLRTTSLQLKNPVILKYGEGLITTQLKHILEKKPLHHFEWDDIPEYPARQLRHTDRRLDPRTGKTLPDPARDNISFGQNYLVPDQYYHRIPVPQRYRDAYWWRERQARRIQCPISWVSYKFWSPELRDRYSFMDLSFQEKFYFTPDDVIAHAKQERR
jgi:hypothetical protein